MNTIEAIRSRRSIRKFTGQPVPEKTVREILSAAMSAPSAGNQQPWQFIIVDNREILDAIPGINPYAAMCREAPVAILVCGDLRFAKLPGYWVQDCSAATQNMLLAAHDKGLGAVWTGIYPVEDRVVGFRELFHLPEEVVPLALVPLGHPAQQPSPQDRFREDRIHYNRWRTAR